MSYFSVGDIVERKKFVGMTAVHNNKHYTVIELTTERPCRIFKASKGEVGLYVRLKGLEDHLFDEHNFMMVKKAIVPIRMDDELFII